MPIVLTHLRSLFSLDPQYRSLKSLRRPIWWGLVINITMLVVCASPLHAAADPNAAQAAVAGTIEAIWKEVLLADGGKVTIFTILCNALKSLAILAIGFETAYLAAMSQAFDNARSFLQEFLLGKMLPTVLIAAALSNNGYIAGNLIYQSKNLFLGIDRVAYESFMFKAGTASLPQAEKDAQSVLQPISDEFENCYSIPDRIGGKTNPVLTQCLSGLSGQIDAAIASGKVQDPETLRKLAQAKSLLDAASSSGDLSSGLIRAGTALRNAVTATNVGGWIEGIVNGLLEALGLAYYIAIELVFLIMAVVSAVVLMLALFKVQVLVKFLPQFLNVFIAKLAYTIAMGLAVILQNKAGGNLGVWGLSLLFGVGCPFISVFMMLALSGSMGSFFERSAMGGAAAGYRGAGKAGGAAIQGAAALASRAGGAIGRSLGGGGKGLPALPAASQTIDVVARRV
jgi:hypothetical protein